ncbi:MAG TPA: type IV toxin-antitoxin system AbiEi family antitoxin [Puia sp.]|nr:type IV toxin-antitoxin system AbiEi family antitoxin [Puia sp.]
MEAILKKQVELKQAIKTFTAATGARVKILAARERQAGREIDARIQVAFRSGQQQFYVEIKGELRQAALPEILTKFGKDKDQWLLVAKYIPGPLKDDLKKNGINYLEVAGNCFVSTDKIYLYINDREVKQVRATPEGKLWKASGLKLLFVIIQDVGLLNATYRRLAELAGIALGSISPLLDELRKEGYIKKDEATGEEILINHERLLRRWVELYPVVLRPKLWMGGFRFLNDEHDDTWRNLQFDDIYWSGDPAAELYTQFLVPETFPLYTSLQASELVKPLKAVPDEKGKIQVFKKFWLEWPENKSIPHAVPPLLVYADLMNGNDSRQWEVAEKIKHTYLNE